MKILYVDDTYNSDIWNLLKKHGHEIEGASTINTVLDLIKEGVDYDVVLLDMHFSYEIEEDIPYGITILKHIRRKSHIPVILFTMYNYSFCKEYTESYPHVSYCQKNDTEKLLFTIEQYGNV